MAESPDILERRCRFSGSKVAVEVHRIRDSRGREATREIVRHGGSVAIVAFPEPGVVLLERNYRYAVEREMLEIPAGTLEEDEDPVACARRELAEETGYRAERFEHLLAVHPSPGFLSERIDVYLADGLEAGEADLEPGEQIQTMLVPMDEALAMIDDGRITDAKTVAALLYSTRTRSKS